jgi:hypothetical protein
MEQRFAKIDKRFETIDRKINHVYGVVDAILKNQEVYEQEQAAIKN